jgi:hypothetical protein
LGSGFIDGFFQGCTIYNILEVGERNVVRDSEFFPIFSLFTSFELWEESEFSPFFVDGISIFEVLIRKSRKLIFSNPDGVVVFLVGENGGQSFCNFWKKDIATSHHFSYRGF